MAVVVMCRSAQAFRRDTAGGSWFVEQDAIIAISKTVTESRLAENFAIFDFERSSEQIAAMHALASPTGRIVSPDGLAPVWDAAG